MQVRIILVLKYIFKCLTAEFAFVCQNYYFYTNNCYA